MRQHTWLCWVLVVLLLMPGAAWGAVEVDDPIVSSQASYFGPVDGDWPIDIGDKIPLQVYLTNIVEDPLDDARVNLVIWAEDDDNPGFPSSAFVVEWGSAELPTTTDLGEYAYLAEGIYNGVGDLSGYFIRPGNYNIYAALAEEIGSGSTLKDVIDNTPKLRSTHITPSINDPNPKPEPEPEKDANKTDSEKKPEPVQKQTIILNLPNQTLQKNGEITKLDTAPIVRDGRTYLPFRSLGEALGAEINYSASTGTVTAKLDKQTVTLVIGSNQMMIDKLTTTIDAPPFIQDGRTMVPLRAAAEAFAFEVTASSNQAGELTDIIIVK